MVLIRAAVILALAAGAPTSAPDGATGKSASPVTAAPKRPDGHEGGPAQLGSIRGRLDIRRVARTAERRVDVTESGTLPRGRQELRRGVVYLETAPRGAFEEREPGRAQLDQRNETFVPHVLAVTVGTVVDFPNSDSIFHNVFSLSKAKRFDLGRYAVGKSKSVRFDRPGIVRVFCDIHSHMNAFVLVFSHPFFAVTERDGRFRLDNLPPGTYTVVGWYEGEQRSSSPLVINAGAIVDLELSVP